MRSSSECMKDRHEKDLSANQPFHFQAEIITVMVSGEIWAIYRGITAVPINMVLYSGQSIEL